MEKREKGIRHGGKRKAGQWGVQSILRTVWDFYWQGGGGRNKTRGEREKKVERKKRRFVTSCRDGRKVTII